jgi:4-amino-4-deoxy-L-arabinose transferase-like glycosyltransferase
MGPRVAAGLALAAACLILLPGLEVRDLHSSHEARAAQNVTSLLASEDGIPRLFDGRFEAQKPPLYYWLAALAVRLGFSIEYAVRLPAALAGVGVIALLLGAGLWTGRPWAGVFAAVVLLASIHFSWLGRIGRIDMPLALTTTAAALGFHLALTLGKSWLLPLAWLACALGVLLKGPVGLALPAAIVAAILLAEGRWPAIWEGGAWWALLRESGAFWGLPLVLAACVPVFAWLHVRTQGAFTEEFFWLHNVARGLGGSRLRAHPWWLYLPYFFLYLLPFSPLLLAALRPGWWSGDPWARAGLAWACGAVALLSAAKFKRADYLLPAYPGAALFLGALLERMLRGRPRLAAWGACGALGLACAAWWGYQGHYVWGDVGFRDYRPLAKVIRESGGSPVYFRAEAHALMYRVGQPARVALEWRELRESLRDSPSLIVLPPALYELAVSELAGWDLEKLGGTAELAGGRHERPLLLIRASRGLLHHATDTRPGPHPWRPPGGAAAGP